MICDMCIELSMSMTMTLYIHRTYRALCHYAFSFFFFCSFAPPFCVTLFNINIRFGHQNICQNNIIALIQIESNYILIYIFLE